MLKANGKCNACAEATMLAASSAQSSTAEPGNACDANRAALSGGAAEPQRKAPGAKRPVAE
eukprot:10145419-Karenia_brevis.AAC.1